MLRFTLPPLIGTLALASSASAQLDVLWDAAAGSTPRDSVPNWQLLTTISGCSDGTVDLQPTYLELDTTSACQDDFLSYSQLYSGFSASPPSGIVEIDARMQVIQSGSASPDRGVATIALVQPGLCPWIIDIEPDRLHFSYNFELGSTVFVDTANAMHDYRIEADVANFEGRAYFDGQLIGTINTAVTNCLNPGNNPFGVVFGQLGAGEPGITRWEFVSHNLGIPVNQFCTEATNLNSLGSTAVLGWAGSLVAADNNLALNVAALPAGSFGYFLCSTAHAPATPLLGSQGELCLGGAIGRFNRPGEIQVASAQGFASLALDLGSIPQPTGAVSVQPGDTWHFQYWYRDANPMPTSNVSSGLQVFFE